MKVTKKTRNNAGFIVTLEILLISTILVIGLITGLAAVRDATVSELADTASAINQIDQGYSYDGKVLEGNWNQGGGGSGGDAGGGQGGGSQGGGSGYDDLDDDIPF